MILDDILARTRADLEVRKQARPKAEMITAAVGRGEDRRSLGAVLRRPGAIACIAEFKRKSPSAGWINETADLESTVRAYKAGGASAVSVLTDEPFFAGRLADLAPARAASGLAVLRKDFIIDPYQICEAAAAGADAILLIVAALGDAALAELLATARAMRLDALVEAHDAKEVERAVAVGAHIIGINNRDLRTFETRLETTYALLPRIPSDRLPITESGILGSRDVEALQERAVHCFLVGEAFMRAPDPGAELARLFKLGPAQ
jgi:indole-3-glycerol phosphate synthase